MLANLTNPDTPGASAKDDTRLGLACTDAQARFEIVVGISYDSTNARHTALAVSGALLYLQKYVGTAADNIDRDIESWLDSLESYRLRTSAAAFSPKTSANWNPSRGPDGRPWSDRANFGDVILDAPRNASDLDGPL